MKSIIIKKNFLLPELNVIIWDWLKVKQFLEKKWDVQIDWMNKYTEGYYINYENKHIIFINEKRKYKTNIFLNILVHELNHFINFCFWVKWIIIDRTGTETMSYTIWNYLAEILDEFDKIKKKKKKNNLIQKKTM